MGLPRQKYWSGLPCSPPAYLPDLWIKPTTPVSHALWADSLLLVRGDPNLLYIHAKSLQLCGTLCDPMDCSPPGSSVHRILQARILEWVALPFSRGSSLPRDWTCVSYVSCTGKLVFFFFFLFVVNFVIHWNKTAMGLHVFPIPIPPPTSLSTRSP